MIKDLLSIRPLSINTGDALFRLAGNQEKPDEEAACSV
jgi:hypothetical protein